MPSPVLRDLAVTFLRLGLTSFGGPAAHIALFRDEFVRRRRWLDDAEYLDMIGAANLIPGPTSTEVAMHLGHRRAGWAGMVVAGLGFILPAAVLVGILAAVYVAFGSRPEIEALLTGVAPVVLAVIAHAGWSLGRAAIRGRWTAAILAATVVASLLGVAELLLIVGMGALALAVDVVFRRTAGSRGQPADAGGSTGPAPAPAGAGPGIPLALAGLPPALAAGEGSRDGGGSVGAATAAAAAVFALGVTTPSLVAVLGAFLKIGALLFGSGYVLVAFLRTELVEGLGWISEAQLLDAIAVGQATPGPYYTTATFVGYLLGGPPAALVATVGIFLPGFVAVALSIPFLHRLRGSPAARGFLDGVNAAAVGLLAVVAARLAMGVFVEPVAVLVALAAFVLLVRGVGSGVLVAGGAMLGLARLVVETGGLPFG